MFEREPRDMGNRIALGCPRVFDQCARGAGCGGHAGEPERRQIVGIELAAQRAREEEELKAQLAAEEADRAAALELEKKAERDARYAARKAAKKERRRGY